VSYSRLIAAVTVVAVVVAACGWQTRSQPTVAPATGPVGANQVPAGRSVPARLQFTAKTIDGQEFNGESLFGRPAVLWFWAPWCSTCQSEAPTVGALAASHPTVTFVGVAGLGQVPAMRAFVDKYPVKNFTQLADPDGLVWAKFGVTQQPAFAFIRPNGSIDVAEGRMSEAELSRRVTAVTNQ
jgi:thiol-disulfide isomerase/thioredoxin